MTRLVRNFIFILLSLSLIHCAGPSGHRIGGQFIVDPNQQQQSRNFLGYPFAPQFTVTATDNTSQQMVAPMDSVEYSAPNWIELCKDYPSADTDRDALSDDCETALRNTGAVEYGALDPYVYNGVLVGGRYFDKGNTKLQLTDEEAEEWKKESKLIGVNGFGAITKESKNVIRKFSALKKRSEPDIYAFKDLFYNYSDEEVRVDQRFVSYIRSPDMFQNAGDDQYIGLARGDGSEAVPFSPSTPGDSVYYLTALAEDTDSILPSTTLMETIEFHVALPRNVDEMQVTIGTLSIDHENEIVGSRSGMYYVMNDGESILLRNDLLNQGGRQYPSSRYGAIHRSVDSCDTAHIVIVYFADGTAGTRRTQLFAENIFYRLNANDSWKNFTQGMLSVQPQGGAGCSQKFTVNDPGHKNMFFRTTNAIASRVHGAVDFNTSLNPGYSNPAFVVSNRTNDSGSITTILKTASSLIPTMDAPRLREFEKSFSQIEPSALSEDDAKLYEEVKQIVADQEATFDPANQNINALDQSIQGLDATSADFEAKKSDLLKQIVGLKADPSLSAEQKKTLEDLESKLNAMTPMSTDMQIELDHQGTIQLPLEEMKNLAGLGFTFTEDQNTYDPTQDLDPLITKNITPQELDSVLEQLDKKLDSGIMSPAEKTSADRLLDGLKTDPNLTPEQKKKITDLESKLDGKDNVVQLDPDGSVILTPEEMKDLSELGFSFKEDQNTFDPLHGQNKDTAKNVTPTELDDILSKLEQKIDSGTLTPEQKTSADQLLDSLKTNPKLTPEQKKKIADLENKLDGKDNVIQLDPAGTVPLALDQMKNLADLGFTFEKPIDSKGWVDDGKGDYTFRIGTETYDPTKETVLGTVKNITPTELDKVLAELDQKIGSGTLTPEQKTSADQLLNSLKTNPKLTPEQKKKISDLENKLDGKDNVVQLDPDGSVILTPEELKDLSELGFNFKEDQNTFDPLNGQNKDTAKNITPTELDDVLAALGDKIDSGTLTPEQKTSADQLLNSLKTNPKLTPEQKKKISDLENKLDGKDNVVQLDPDGSVILTPEELKDLSELGFNFKEDQNTFDPLNGQNKDTAKNVTPAELDDVLAALGDKIDSGTLTPEQKTSADQLLDSLKTNPNLTPEQKKKISDLEKQLSAKTGSEENMVKLDQTGSVPLSLREMKDLAGLGFQFKEGENTYNPTREKNASTVKNITPDEAKEILNELGTILDSDSLTPEEKQKIENFAHKLKSVPGIDSATSAAVDEFLKKHADDFSLPKDANTIQLLPTGQTAADQIPLTLDEMKELAGIGFKFSEGKNPYDPTTEKDLDTVKNTTPEELNRVLDDVLGRFDKQLESGKLSAEQKNDMINFLEDQKKKKGVDADKIDQFLKDHAGDLFNWTPEQIEYLKKLDADQDSNPDFGSDLDTWSQGFPSLEESQAAKQRVADSVMKKLVTQNTLLPLQSDEKDLAIQKRIGIASELKKQGFLDDEQYTGLLLKLFPLNNSKLNLSSLGKVTVKSDGRLVLDGAKILFGSGTNQIDANGENVLRTIAEYLKNYKTIVGTELHVNITAYTDSAGDETINRNLSLWRAESVRDFLMAKPGFVKASYKYGKDKTGKLTSFSEALSPDMALPEANIVIEGKGEADPIADNNTAAGKAKNRRVKITLITK